MTRRISPEGRLHDYHPDVGKIWRSRDDEPEQEMFERQPTWMQTEPTDRDDLIDLQRVVPQILETITSREQKLLWCRLWADYTLDEIGMVFGVTKERIRQIEAKALRKLKHPSRSDLLLPFANICPVKIRKENERVKEYQRWWREQHEKEMLERHIKYMENRLIETLLELRENT